MVSLSLAKTCSGGSPVACLDRKYQSRASHCGRGRRHVGLYPTSDQHIIPISSADPDLFRRSVSSNMIAA
eukprot:3279237-Rhodomonas_salina.4